MEEQNYLSQEKYDELTKELEELKGVKRKEVAEKLEYAKSLGDLSENTEYQEARETQANIEERISKVEALLKSAIITTTHKGDIVDIGSFVTVQMSGSEEEKRYELVGSEEADVSQWKISNKSPIGDALFGKKKGDSFSYSAPRGEAKGSIIRVE